MVKNYTSSKKHLPSTLTYTRHISNSELRDSILFYSLSYPAQALTYRQAPLLTTDADTLSILCNLTRMGFFYPPIFILTYQKL